MSEQATETEQEQAPETDAQEAPEQSTEDRGGAHDDVESLPQWARDKLTQANRQAATYRTKLREAEPLAKKARELEDAQKSEQQRMSEQAEQVTRERDVAVAEALRYRIAARHGISEDNLDLLGSGAEEEIEARAARVAAMQQDPRKGVTPERPTERLRPGASPTEIDNPEDNAYPTHWLPSGGGSRT